MTPPPALIALGSNLPLGGVPPAALLRAALARLGALGWPVVAVSRFYESPAFPPGSGPAFVNAAAALTPPPGAGPEELLVLLHQVEAEFGRARAQRWGARTLDLDLLAWGDCVLPDAETQAAWRGLSPAAAAQKAPAVLILPHPRLQDRAFVLQPLAEIAPDWRHPSLGQTTLALRDALPGAARESLRPLAF